MKIKGPFFVDKEGSFLTSKCRVVSSNKMNASPIKGK